MLMSSDQLIRIIFIHYVECNTGHTILFAMFYCPKQDKVLRQHYLLTYDLNKKTQKNLISNM
jgi:hypothetical protein